MPELAALETELPPKSGVSEKRDRAIAIVTGMKDLEQLKAKLSEILKSAKAKGEEAPDLGCSRGTLMCIYAKKADVATAHAALEFVKENSGKFPKGVTVTPYM